MKTEIVNVNHEKIAILYSEKTVIADTQSALDFMMTVKYETGCTNIALNKEAFADSFFVLSTRLAGEILQKFVNYGVRLAIYGDFSNYASKPLNDFMFECNKGTDIFFQPDASLAAQKLSERAGRK